MQQPHRIDRGRGALLALAMSGALGFHLGYARFPDWQVPVETAQVLAGLVTYPHETPFYVYHVKLWTLLHQVCAVFLIAGVSEIALSRVLSGVLGMVSFQALAMVGFAFSGRALIATGAALLIFVSGVAQAGAVYPIFLMGVPFTYGVIGLSLIVLGAATIGAGLHRTGAFLLGVAPAVHPSLGLWLWILVGGCVVVDRQMRAALRAAAPSLLAGAAVTAASFAVHLMMAAGVPSEPAATSRRYFDAFVAVWDGHRRPIALTETAVLVNATALVISSVWLRWFRHEVPPSAALLLRFLQVSALVGLSLVPLSWVPPHRLPVTVVMLMPGRVLNINAMTFAATLLGLLGSSRAAWRTVLMLAMAAGLLVGNASMVWQMVPDGRPAWVPAIDTRSIAFAFAAASLIGAAAARWLSSARAERGAQWTWPRPVPALVWRVAVMAVFLGAGVVAYRVPDARRYLFIDRTNNALLASAAAGDGLLLTIGDLHLVQLRTRRPQLIDTGGLDAVAYMPETGPALHRILSEIYGIDLFNPPPEVRGSGRLPPEVHRRRWEAYTADEWRTIRRTYHVTQVLTGADWQLDLPIVASDRRFLLYAIPE